MRSSNYGSRSKISASFNLSFYETTILLSCVVNDGSKQLRVWKQHISLTVDKLDPATFLSSESQISPLTNFIRQSLRRIYVEEIFHGRRKPLLSRGFTLSDLRRLPVEVKLRPSKPRPRRSSASVRKAVKSKR